jgi:hypothetical protein
MKDTTADTGASREIKEEAGPETESSLACAAIRRGTADRPRFRFEPHLTL